MNIYTKYERATFLLSRYDNLLNKLERFNFFDRFLFLFVGKRWLRKELEIIREYV